MLKVKTYFILIVLFILSIPIVHADSVDEWHNKGGKYLLSRDYDSAIEAYSHALEIDENDSETYNARGVAYRNKGDATLAIVDFNKAIELNPTYADAYLNRGLAYRLGGYRELQIKDYMRVLELDKRKDDAEHLAQMGMVWNVMLREYDLAIIYCDKAISINPDSYYSYSERGYAYSKLSKYKEAINDFQTAIKLYPKEGMNYFYLAQSLEMIGDKDGAVENYRIVNERKLYDSNEKKYSKIKARLNGDWDSYKEWI